MRLKNMKKSQNIFDFNDVSGEAKCYSDLSKDEMNAIVKSVSPELFEDEFSSSFFSTFLLWLGLFSPSLDFVGDIINIRSIINTGLYISIGYLMFFNLLITPTIVATYRQNRTILGKIQALS